jgi:hypothetical protein
VKEYTLFDPDVFGFHENYHVSTVVSFIAAYVMNYSIMERKIVKETPYKEKLSVSF